MTDNLAAVLFPDDSIRTAVVRGQCLYCIVDVIRALVDTPNLRRYWNGLKHEHETYAGIVQMATIPDPNEKLRLTDATNLEGLLFLVCLLPAGRRVNAVKQRIAVMAAQAMREGVRV